MNGKVAVIGIDGMDSLLVEQFLGDMPNFRQLQEKSPAYRFTSIFPPDSTPAWASIYTGLTPAGHGLINFVNPGERKGTVKRREITDADLKGRTFWDLAGKQGKRVCLVLPFNIFPGWPVSGAMVCRINTVASRSHPLSALPGGVLEKYSPSPGDLNMLQEYFSRKDFPKLIEMCRRRTLAEGDLARKMLRGEDWDLFLVYFSALDGIQHFFWSFFDETHPHYPGDNRFKEVIKDFYVLIDQMVGEIVKALGNIPIIILSDHGHGIRPTHLLNINEVLRQHGYLASAEKAGKKVNPLLKASRIKQLLTSYVQRFGVGNLGLKLAQKFPLWKRLLASPLSIDWNRTRAYVTDLSAIKSYSYGGIRINRELVPAADLEGVIQEILALLGEIRDPRTSRQIVKFAGKREDLYRGPFIDRYPEIVLELEEGYGLGWEINGDLFDYGFMHSLQPGSHKKDTPVLYTLNLATDATRPLTLMDLAPTILACLGVVPECAFDGESFVRA